MCSDALIDTVIALGALPGALLQSLPPARQAQRLGQRAGVAARRAVWYSALAALTLLAPPERAPAPSAADSADGLADPPGAMPEGVSGTAPDEAVPSPPGPPTWAATLLVLAVIGAQIAQRRQRRPFTA